jgi:hypothetical protein
VSQIDPIHAPFNFLKSILILSCHLRLGIWSGFLAPVFATKSPVYTRWFKYDRDYLCVNKSQSVPVIFEPPCTSSVLYMCSLPCPSQSSWFHHPSKLWLGIQGIKLLVV